MTTRFKAPMDAERRERMRDALEEAEEKLREALYQAQQLGEPQWDVRDAIAAVCRARKFEGS